MSEQPRFKVYTCLFLAGGFWASGFAFLCLSFHICRMGMKIPTLKFGSEEQHWVCMQLAPEQ